MTPIFPVFLRVLSNSFLKSIVMEKGGGKNYFDLLNMIGSIINRKMYISLNMPK
jgi:hypothetical protein